MLFVSHLSLNLTGWLFTSTLSLHCNIISTLIWKVQYFNMTREEVKQSVHHFPFTSFSLKQWDIAPEMWVSFGRVCHAIGLAVSVHWTKIITCWNGEREEIDIQPCFVERKILTRMQPVEIINTNNSDVFKVSIFYIQTLMHMHTAGWGHYTLYESSKTHNMNT